MLERHRKSHFDAAGRLKESALIVHRMVLAQSGREETLSAEQLEGGAHAEGTTAADATATVKGDWHASRILIEMFL